MPFIKNCFILNMIFNYKSTIFTDNRNILNDKDFKKNKQVVSAFFTSGNNNETSSRRENQMADSASRLYAIKNKSHHILDIEVLNKLQSKNASINKNHKPPFRTKCFYELSIFGAKSDRIIFDNENLVALRAIHSNLCHLGINKLINTVKCIFTSRNCP